MKKEDFIGKWYLRWGDLIPEQIFENDFEPRKQRLFCVQFCESLNKKGFIFDSKEEAMSRYRCIMGAMKMNPNPEYVGNKIPQKPRIYISGPISNTNREECFEAFRKAEEFLESKGYRAFSPLKNGLPFEADVHLHMRRDLNILTNEEDSFDYIYMLRRWPHSSGCKTELDNAIASGITVVFEESNEAIKFV